MMKFPEFSDTKVNINISTDYYHPVNLIEQNEIQVMMNFMYNSVR
jgi:hypothetical protein